jgi:hypothetical protein
MKKYVISVAVIIIIASVIIYYFLTNNNNLLTLCDYQNENSDIDSIIISTDKRKYNSEDKFIQVIINNQYTENISTDHSYNIEINKNGKLYFVNVNRYYHLDFLGIKIGKMYNEYLYFSDFDYKFTRGNKYRITKIINNYNIVSNTFIFE